jgi:hypothetical protein
MLLLTSINLTIDTVNSYSYIANFLDYSIQIRYCVLVRFLAFKDRLQTKTVSNSERPGTFDGKRD